MNTCQLPRLCPDPGPFQIVSFHWLLSSNFLYCTLALFVCFGKRFQRKISPQWGVTVTVGVAASEFLRIIGFTEIRTEIAGVRAGSAYRYTRELPDNRGRRPPRYFTDFLASVNIILLCMWLFRSSPWSWKTGVWLKTFPLLSLPCQRSALREQRTLRPKERSFCFAVERSSIPGSQFLLFKVILVSVLRPLRSSS